MKKKQETLEGMIFYPKESIELLHLIEERTKGIPIITLFEFESQNYKYGKELYCNVIKKQIEDAFEFTSIYADRELNMSFDDYVGFCILDPDSETELKALNELLEYLQNSIKEIGQAPPQEKKQGRPKTVIQEANYYLHNKELLQFLIDNYSNVTPRVFNQLLTVLAEIDQLRPATNKEYKQAFEKALNVAQAQANFDSYFKAKKIDETFNHIKTRIKNHLGL